MSARSFDINGKMRQGNITVLNDQDVVAVILHNTTVMMFSKKLNKIKLTSGGWMTPTTKTAINNALSQLESIVGQSMPQVFQKKGEWFLTDGTKFQDGMELAVYPLMQALS
jgi:hypothetical protein